MILMIIFTIIWIFAGLRMSFVESDRNYRKVSWGGIIFLLLTPIMAFWGLYI